MQYERVRPWYGEQDVGPIGYCGPRILILVCANKVEHKHSRPDSNYLRPHNYLCCIPSYERVLRDSLQLQLQVSKMKDIQFWFAIALSGVTHVSSFPLDGPKCPLTFDGRIPQNFTRATFDTSKSPFNPKYVRGMSKTSELS